MAVRKTVRTPSKEVLMIQSELTRAVAATRPDAVRRDELPGRYRGATLRADTQDLRSFLRWRAERAVEPC